LAALPGAARRVGAGRISFARTLGARRWVLCGRLSRLCSGLHLRLWGRV